MDVFDALVSRRVYKQPYAVEEAFRMIFEGECGVFSPVILDCLRLAKYDAEEKLSFADGEMVEREEADV